MSITKNGFGVTKEGREASIYRLSNESGAWVTVTDFGAAWVSAWMPDKNGIFEDVLLGYDQVEGYQSYRGHLGGTVGRNGNRIGGARFLLDGREVVLPVNDNGLNNLHSGPDFYDQRMWDAQVDEENRSVRFTLESPDGDQGFPGNAHISVTYTLTDDNTMRITYDACADQKTLFNMTNHSYFNLAGQDSGTVLDHVVTLEADGYTETDRYSIPTGKVIDVAGTPMDFTAGRRIGDDIDCGLQTLKDVGGYDHNWILRGAPGTVRRAALVKDPASGRCMEVRTDTPGIQFYTGNYLNAVGKGGAVYTARCGLCLESQYVPNCQNLDGFDKPFFEAGEKYHSVTEYRFFCGEAEDGAVE